MGDGDMRAMVQLDSDKARLHSKGDQAARDIVQFVRECQNELFGMSITEQLLTTNFSRSEHVPSLWKLGPCGFPTRARSSKSSAESGKGCPPRDSQTGPTSLCVD